MVAVAARVQAQEAKGQLALQFVRHADHRAFGHIGVRSQNLLHAASREAVACDVDHVIGARHDIEVAVLVLHARIAGFVIAGEGVQIALLEALFGVPQVGQGAGGQGQLDRDRAKGACLDRMTGLVQNLHIVAGHRNRRAAEFDRQLFNPQRVRGDRPTCFGLPPVVDDRNVQLFLCPFDGRGVRAFARQIYGAQSAQVVLLDELAGRVFAAHCAEGGRRSEEGFDLMLVDNAPEGARIGGANGLAFEDDGGVAGDQRTIADIAVPHDPTHVRRGPEDFAGLDVVDVLHGPVQRD